MSKYGARAKMFGLVSEELSAWIVALVVLVAGGALTAALAFATQMFYQQQLRQRFELLADERRSRIAERFADQEQRLDGLRRFFSYSSEILPEEFDGYTRPLLQRTQAYSWVPRVEAAQRQLFERKAGDWQGRDYVIRDVDPQGRWQPAPARDHYYPVLYTQSSLQSDLPFGFDLAAQPLREETLRRALTPGSMAVSKPLDMLSVEPAYTRGLLIAAPVFFDASVRGPPAGYVIALLSLRQMITDGLPAGADDNLVVRILDQSPGRPAETLYDSANTVAALALQTRQSLQLADHVYQLEIRPSEAFADSNRSSAMLIVLLLGGLLSLLLSALLYSLFNQRQRALILVEQRTAELRALSVTDALTGIYNRRYFQERLKSELERARRAGQALAVIMLDVDHFKCINDRFGHAAGDQVLQVLCQRIGERLRGTDVFCRMGGEEFVVLCPGSDVMQARVVALELWQGLREVPVEGVGRVTASFGVAGWRAGEHADGLLSRADAGVYRAKQEGRDRVEVVGF